MNIKFLKLFLPLLTVATTYHMADGASYKQKEPINPLQTAVKAKVLQVTFYKEGENEPVRDWLMSGDIGKEGRKKIGDEMAEVEHYWPNGADVRDIHTKNNALWELRTDLPDSRSTRVTFLAEKDKMVLLYGFLKHADKQQKDIEFANERANKYHKQQEAAEKENKKNGDGKKQPKK